MIVYHSIFAASAFRGALARHGAPAAVGRARAARRSTYCTPEVTQTNVGDLTFKIKMFEVVISGVQLFAPVSFKRSIAMASEGVDAMRFLPSAQIARRGSGDPHLAAEDEKGLPRR